MCNNKVNKQITTSLSKKEMARKINLFYKIKIKKIIKIKLLKDTKLEIYQL
jgi:hypothetical protein